MKKSIKYKRSREKWYVFYTPPLSDFYPTYPTLTLMPPVLSFRFYRKQSKLHTAPN